MQSVLNTVELLPFVQIIKLFVLNRNQIVSYCQLDSKCLIYGRVPTFELNVY